MDFFKPELPPLYLFENVAMKKADMPFPSVFGIRLVTTEHLPDDVLALFFNRQPDG